VLTSSQMNEEPARKKQILEAAARVFCEKGFHGATMHDIGSIVGMNKATLYYWVSSKEAVLNEILTTGVAELLDLTRHIPQAEMSPEDKIRELVKIHLRSAAQIRDVMHLALREFHVLTPELREPYLHLRRAYEQVWKDVLIQGAEQKIFHPIPHNLSIYFVLGALNTFPVWYREDGALDPEKIADIYADLVLACLKNAPIDKGAEAR
jgi:TetR/AcrR family transcriptional regulator, cholesterol catabolism regulator